MTTSAYGRRRIFGGASLAKNMEPPERNGHHSLYRDLHPEMFKSKPRARSVTPLANKIRAWLVENGPATSSEIALGIEQKHVSSVAYSLRNSDIGAVVVGKRRTAKGMEVEVWGVSE